MEYYELRVRFEKTDEVTGKSKKVTLPYIIEGESFGDVEEKMSESFIDDGISDFEIKSIRIANIDEIHNIEEGIWFNAVVTMLDVDETTGKEKKQDFTILIGDKDITDAKKNIEAKMKDIIVTWRLKSLKETKIVDVYKITI